MKNSYNDFFKAAKSAKKGNTSVKRKNRPQSKRPQKSLAKPKSRKKSSSFSIASILSLIICVLMTGWGYLNLDEVISFIERVEVSPVQMTQAAAKDEAKKTTTKGSKQEKSSSSTEDLEAKNKADLENITPEKIKHFSKLNQRKKELDQREAELNELERELHEQRKEVEARILKLEEIRSQIGQVLREKVEVDEDRVKKLVEFYSNMKPQNAAKIIATLNEDLAVEILGKMKKKNAADILNLLKPNKAQVLTEKFAGYKRR